MTGIDSGPQLVVDNVVDFPLEPDPVVVETAMELPVDKLLDVAYRLLLLARERRNEPEHRRRNFNAVYFAHLATGRLLDEGEAQP